MIWVDWIILVISVGIIAVSALTQSNEDAVDAFKGSSSDLFKNKKMQGAELFLTRAMIALFVGIVVFVLVSNNIERTFLLNLI